MIKLGNVHLVTGYAGREHVTSADQGALNAALFGAGQYVLGKGKKFEAQIITNNQIRILDGDILMQGRHVRLNEGSYVDLSIENGAQGYFRNDLIVARYTKNESTDIEDVNLVVIKGTAVASDPVDPEYTTGDIINEGAILHDMPLYRVVLDGLNVQPLDCLFNTREETLSDFVDVLNQKVPMTRTVAGVKLTTDISVAQLLSALAAYYVGGTDVAIADGGTGASDAATARANLGITPANIGAAASSHNHAASSITSGTFDVARLPTVTIAKGGTGATNGATGLKNLFAAGYTVLTEEKQFGTMKQRPTPGQKGRIFFVKAGS